MNYYSLVKRILSVFSPSVEQVNEGDVYEWMNNHQHRYPAVNLTVQYVSSDIDFQTINCEIIYMDRLMDDKSNRLNIQSTGMTLLKKGVIRLQEEFDISGISYNPFTDKNKDLIAGCIVTLNITLPEDFICDEDLPRNILNITKNGKYDVTGYDEADVEVLPLPIQQKQITITKNGTYEIKPDDGYLLDKVEVDVNLTVLNAPVYVPPLKQGIDTGIVVTDEDFVIEMKSEFVQQLDYNNDFFSSQINDVATSITGVGNAVYFKYATGTSWTIINNILQLNVPYVVKLDKTGATINGVFYPTNTRTPGYTNTPVTLYYNHITGQSYPHRFYYIKIWHKGELVCYWSGKYNLVESRGYIYDELNKVVVYDPQVTTLELSEATQTITVTNEEYEAIAPILSEMRGEELPDVPKPVVI